jgi:hypothetical protein
MARPVDVANAGRRWPTHSATSTALPDDRETTFTIWSPCRTAM